MIKEQRKTDWPSRTFRIPPELLKRLDAFCTKSGISKTFIIKVALEKYLDENELK